MIKLGLTGSIGMGKSETAKMFQAHGIPVFDADATVHGLLAQDTGVMKQVGAAFEGVLKDHAIDRAQLGAAVFGQPGKLKMLEDILHPRVAEARADFLAAAQDRGAKIILLDIPLLYEKAYDDLCDYVAVVSAPAPVQEKRVLARPGMTAEKFRDILALQIPDEEKKARADFIIESHKGLDHANRQVEEIIKTLQEKI